MNEFAKPNLAVDQFPPASVADSGKVLTVGEDGVPAWGQGGGGGGGSGMRVTISVTTEGNNKTYTFDKTLGEILPALESGTVFVDCPAEAQGTLIHSLGVICSWASGEVQEQTFALLILHGLTPALGGLAPFPSDIDGVAIEVYGLDEYPSKTVSGQE